MCVFFFFKKSLEFFFLQLLFCVDPKQVIIVHSTSGDCSCEHVYYTNCFIEKENSKYCEVEPSLKHRDHGFAQDHENSEGASTLNNTYKGLIPSYKSC